jgi:dTDP-4-amino-4,6-dideoxygalactose transaminase
MDNSKIYLSSSHTDGNEMSYIIDAFEKNKLTTSGHNIDTFEEDLEKYLRENSHVATLSSGTAAIHLALILLGIKRDDFVICQSMTFSASANPILYQGAIPVFVDSETETWNLCPIFLEEAIRECIAKGKKPKAIIAVHLYGIPYQIEAIRTIADQYEIPIIEDSAEALGSSYKGQKCGTFGDFGILSFNGNKIITTSGGGALITKTKELKEKTIFLSTQARDQAPHYQHSEVGYNYRMSNICAGIGRGQMEVLDSHVAARRKMNEFYCELFEKIKGVEVFQTPNDDYFPNYWLSCILIDSSKTGGKTNNDLRLFLESKNIESRPLWKPMHLQPVFKHFAFFGTTISETLFKTGLCLPSGSNVSENEKNRIKVAIKNFFSNH